MSFFKFFKIEDELNIVILQFGVSETFTTEEAFKRLTTDFPLH